MEQIPLYKLREGDWGRVVTAAGENRRLTDLGLIEGTRVKCLYKSPLRDPAAYEIRGAVVAIRRKDCREVLVTVDRDAEKGGAGNAPPRKHIALAGNPNVGKSTVFNCLTGMRQHTGNWAGKTVSNARGLWKVHLTAGTSASEEICLLDIPGCYSLQASSLEEAEARDFLRSDACDGVIVVCDGTCLERNLILVLQILALGRPVAVCVNLMDQARRRRIVVDAEKLSALLGIPVVTTEAKRKKEMKEKLEQLIRDGHFDTKSCPVDAPVCALLDFDPMMQPARTVQVAEAIAEQTVSRAAERPDVSRRIDHILTSPWTGFPVMALLLWLVFWITMQGANYPSAMLSDLLFRFEAPLYTALSAVGLPVEVCEALACGMYRVLAWVVSVMLPPMAIFFPLFTLLEDWGFLPRVAFNLDRCFQCCKACGKQALTTCMGFGCNACAVVGCRIIDAKRERLMAMVTNGMIPCNGRFPLLICIITMFFAAEGGIKAASLLTGVILLGVAASMLGSKLLSLTVLKGMPSSFTLEMPPFRKPEIGKVIVRSVLDRTIFVLGRAVMVAAPAGLLIWILANIDLGGGISPVSAAAEFLDPVGRFLGLDGVILLAFILGLPANEIVLPLMLMLYMSQGTLTEVGAFTDFQALLVANGWTTLTALNVMLFCLMHWPCATTILSIKKEAGSGKWVLVSILLPLVMGVGCCLLTRTVWCLL